MMETIVSRCQTLSPCRRWKQNMYIWHGNLQYVYLYEYVDSNFNLCIFYIRITLSSDSIMMSP